MKRNRNQAIEHHSWCTSSRTVHCLIPKIDIHIWISKMWLVRIKIDHSFKTSNKTKRRLQSRKTSSIGYQIERTIESTYRCIESADNVKTDTIPEIIIRVFTSIANLHRVLIWLDRNISNMHYLFLNSNTYDDCNVRDFSLYRIKNSWLVMKRNNMVFAIPYGVAEMYLSYLFDSMISLQHN